MAITEMNFASGGGASSADKVSCIDAQGNKSDVQTELNKLYEGDVYSEEERIVGYWNLNGVNKPIYQRYVNNLTPYSSGTGGYNTDVNDCYLCLNCKLFGKVDSDTSHRELSNWYNNASDYLNYGTWLNINTLNIWTGTTHSISDPFAIVEYIKVN